VADLTSWGIVLFEYLIQVPAYRNGYGSLTISQHKVLQEVITIWVFVSFTLFWMQQPLKMDSLWGGLCQLGAAYFRFRN
jgi:uncharacterized protein (DUF486 family)